MAKTASTLPYDKTSPESIFEYSKGLLGQTLRDFALENYVPKKGKGCLTHHDATNVQQKHLRTLILCTTYNYSNRLNRQRVFSLNRKSANEWFGENLPNNECTLVHCLGHSSNRRASAPY